ncbi:MAG TPA: glycosyltransferase [Galbitalea sp.]
MPSNEMSQPLEQSAGSLDVAQSTSEVTVVIPTRNEAENIKPLVDRLLAAFSASGACTPSVDILFVDDSDDSTIAAILAICDSAGEGVAMVHRAKGHRPGGLAGATLVGLECARTPLVIVMDADLQHPPEVCPGLLETMAGASHPDIAIATRYAPGGSSAGLSRFYRVVASRIATKLAQHAAPESLRAISDPMSGFFALRMTSIDLQRVKPRGFKILVELLIHNSDAVVSEYAYDFALRHSGTSKATLLQGGHFLRQVWGVRAARRRARKFKRAA